MKDWGGRRSYFAYKPVKTNANARNTNLDPPASLAMRISLLLYWTINGDRIEHYHYHHNSFSTFTDSSCSLVLDLSCPSSHFSSLVFRANDGLLYRTLIPLQRRGMSSPRQVICSQLMGEGLTGTGQPQGHEGNCPGRKYDLKYGKGQVVVHVNRHLARTQL